MKSETTIFVMNAAVWCLLAASIYFSAIGNDMLSVKMLVFAVMGEVQGFRLQYLRDRCYTLGFDPDDPESSPEGGGKVTCNQPTKLETFLAIALIALMAVACFCGCSDSESAIIRDVQPNGGFVIDAEISPNPSNSTGLEIGKRPDHFADVNKMVENTPVTPAKQPGVKLRFYTSKHGCHPCKVFLKWREANASTVDCPMEHLQFDSMEKAAIAFPEGIPRFELTKRDGSVEVRTGWSEKPNHEMGVLCPGCLRNWVRAAKGLPNLEFDQPAADQRVSAMPIRSKAAQAIEWIRVNVGENVPMTFRWARTGLQTFPVYGAPQNWSIESICGKYGFVELSAPGCKLPVDHASVKYDVNGDKIGIETRVEFDLPNGTPKAGAKPVGFVDPASILTVFSVLRSVWAIFKTRISVDLGGNVEAKAVLVGDVLAVDFSQGPSVRIESLFSFYVAVKRVELTTDKCRVLFSGSRFLKERTFQLN